MQKKSLIILILLTVTIVIFVFVEIPVEIKTVPVATIRVPKISWVSEYGDENRDPEPFLVQPQINYSSLVYTCPEKKSTGPKNDILCLKPPKFLPQYKNPCWYQGESSKLSCLPYFLQIGLSKCATTDLFTRLMLHPDIIPIDKDGKSKSLSWWNLRLTGSAWQSPYRDLWSETFQQYIEHFKYPAKVIEQSQEQNGNNNKITGEGSPTYIWMLYLWKRIPQNEHLSEPRYLIPHLIRHVLPDMKFIVILRDPIERMYSSYHFFNTESKYDEYTFHSSMVSGIQKFNDCKLKKSDRLCVLDPDIRETLTVNNARFINGIYYILIKEWLDVFPRNQFLFIKMEEYVTRKQEVLNRVFKFLGVKTLSQDEMEKLGLLYTTIKNKTKGDKQYKPMLNKTRELLYEFYDPYTTRLPQLLNDSTFVWPKLSYQEYVNKMEKKRTKTDES